jgi:RNA 2',3'-cyclic 3'-phosphodiesterase
LKAEPARARLFFALWPDPGLQAALASCARTAQSECGGRATAVEKIHLTLVFVGSVERSRIGELEALAAAVPSAPFELEFSRLGYWRRQRIVWAGATRTPPELVRFVGSLSGALSGLGLTVDERPYVPHITLLRNARCAPQRLRISPVWWSVHDYALVESRPVDGGVRYGVIRRWPLRSAGGAALSGEVGRRRPEP